MKGNKREQSIENGHNEQTNGRSIALLGDGDDTSNEDEEAGDRLPESDLLEDLLKTHKDGEREGKRLNILLPQATRGS